MIACYLRVSSRSQRLDSQEAEIQKWLAANGIDPGQVTWYRDHESGTTLKRPAFERMQRDIFSGAVKTVILWKLDRLSRRLRDGVNTLADWCDQNVKVVVVTQQLQFDGPVGRMVAALLLGLGEIETAYRQERQAAGIEQAKKRGVYKGRRIGTTKAKPERARQLAAKGLNPAEIAAALSVSERTAFRYLRPSTQ